MICGGYKNTISGTNTSCSIIAHGNQNKINGGNHSGIFTGWKNVISDGAYYSAILNGEGCLCNSERQAVMGTYNVSSSDGYSFSSYLVVGNGSGDNSRSNAFRVDAGGNVYAGASINGTGADFAEMREWSDGNPNNEDRRGLFVIYDDSLDYAIGEYAKIRIANANDNLDDIIGIVSSNPTVVGNTASEIWQGMYLRDIFGNVLTQVVTIPAVTREIENPETKEITIEEVVPEHTEIQPIINPDYDATKLYICREMRKEWAKIGMVGMIVTVDDGSCKMLEYCKVSNNGIATHSDVKTRFKVVARLDDTHIAVEIR